MYKSVLTHLEDVLPIFKCDDKNKCIAIFHRVSLVTRYSAMQSS